LNATCKQIKQTLSTSKVIGNNLNHICNTDYLEENELNVALDLAHSKNRYALLVLMNPSKLLQIINFLQRFPNLNVLTVKSPVVSDFVRNFAGNPLAHDIV